MGVFIDSKTVFAAFASGAQSNTCAVPVAGAPEDLDYDAKITDAVRAASQQLAPNQKTALLAIPGEAAIVRCFELPALPKKEEIAAVRFEAQKYVPFELKDICYDYDALPDASRKHVSILFYAAKKSTVERLVSTVEGAGLSVAAVETLSNALARSFNQEIAKNSGVVYMLIRTNEDQTAEVVIAKNQTVLLARHVTLSQQPSSPKWDATPFLAEIRLSFDYFSDIFRGQSVSKIYVSSPAREDMQALTEKLHRTFSMAVEAVSSAGPGGPSAAGLAVAHGLALRDLPGPRGKKINLKPQTSASSARPAGAVDSKTNLKDFATKVLAAAAAIVVAAYFFFNHSVSTRRAELQRLSAAFPSSESTPITSDKAVLQERKTALGQRLAYFVELVDRRRFLTHKMNALAQSVPAGVHLLAFIYDDDVTPKGQSVVSLRLEGVVAAGDQAVGLSIVNKLVAALNADKDFMRGFSQIKITSAKQAVLSTGEAAVRFDLECAGTSNAPIIL